MIFNTMIKAKAIALIAVLVLILFVAGCGLWPFGKKDNAEDALKLKSQTEQIFTSAQTNTKDFDSFLVKLHKRWYTAKDVQEFSNELSTFDAKFKKDKAQIATINSNLSQLAELDRDAKYTQFIKTKAKAAEVLAKSISNGQSITSALNPKMVSIAKFYSQVDKAKKAQSKYVTVLLSSEARQTQASLTKSLIDVVLNPPPAPVTSTPDSGTDTGSGTGTGTGTDTGTGSGSGTSTDTASSDLDPWIFQIAKNEWYSTFIKDFVKNSSDDFNNLYQEVYITNKEINFENSKKLVNYLQQVKTDNADFVASIEDITNNLREQKRLIKARDRANQTIAALQASYDGYSSLDSSRPAGVSPDSLAARGVKIGRDVSAEEITRYKEKVRDLNKRIKKLESALAGSLSTNYEEADWRFRGSLVALYKLNISISRDLMHETKRWKSRAILKVLKHEV